jgi:hypothetical protein
MHEAIRSVLRSMATLWLACGVIATGRGGNEKGQTTAEYALVLLVAGLIVGVFAAFVRSGSLTGMFHTIVSGLIHRAGG